jgi:uncharacterized protein YqgC (DUF456 family)
MATLRVLKWVGIIIGLWITVGLVLSIFIPFPFSVPIVLFVVAVIAYLIRNRERKKALEVQGRKAKFTED